MLNNLTRPLALALEKAAALESLAESELKYRSLVAQAEEMIFLIDATSLRVIEANAYAARVLGYGTHELTGVPISRISGESADRLIALLASLRDDGELRLSDATFCRRDGSIVTVDVVASPVVYGRRAAVPDPGTGCLRASRDHAPADAEPEDGIARGDGRRRRTRLQQPADNHPWLRRAAEALIEPGRRRARKPRPHRRGRAPRCRPDRPAAFVFARRAGAVSGASTCGRLSKTRWSWREPTLHAGITVRVEMPAEPVYVEGDSGQLQQALTNIVLNARDAMPEGGVIDLRTGERRWPSLS